MAWRSPSRRPKTRGARTKRFFAHWVGRIERRRAVITAGIVRGGRLRRGLRHETLLSSLHRPPPPAPRLDRPAARPRHRDPLPARHFQCPSPHEGGGGGGPAPRDPAAHRPLAGRRPAARPQPPRRPLLSGQPSLSPRLADLGAQRPLLAPPPPRPVRLRLDGPHFKPAPRGGLGGGGLLHAERLLPVAPLFLQPDRRRHFGPRLRRRLPHPPRPRAAALGAAGGSPPLGPPPPRRRSAEGAPRPPPPPPRPAAPAWRRGGPERPLAHRGLGSRHPRSRPRRLAAGTLLAAPQIVEFVRILPLSFRGHWGYTTAVATVAS